LRKRDPTEVATPISPPAPRRRLGRPPRTPGDVKRYPLSLYVTKELKERLVEASKVSGRPLTQEIEDRLQRTFEEDRGKDEREIRLDILAREIIELVRRNWEAGPLVVSGYRPPSEAAGEPLARTDDPALDQHDGDRKAGDQTRHPVDMQYGESRKGPRLPVEIEVARGEDGNVVLFSRRGGVVIQETQTPVDIAAAIQLVGEVELAVSESGEPKRKSRRSG
jgi:hypothetical protein